MHRSNLRGRAALALLPFVVGPLLGQASYATFGTGCRGSGSGRLCGSANPTAKALGGVPHDGRELAIAVPAAPTLRIISAVELFTHARRTTSGRQLSVALYRAAANGRPGTVLQRASMLVISGTAWYRALFKVPVIVPANQRLFLVYGRDAANIAPSIAQTGVTVPHYWRIGQTSSWSGPHPVPRRWAYRLFCAKSGTTLSHTGLPRLGTSFTVDLTGGKRVANALFVLGVSSQNWRGLRLPLSLQAAGAAGCSVFVSGELVFPISTDWKGEHRFRLTVPNQPALRGLRFFNQYVVEDAAANAFGATFSNAGVGTIG